MADKDEIVRATVEYALRQLPNETDGPTTTSIDPVVFESAKSSPQHTSHPHLTGSPPRFDTESNLWEPLIEQLEYWAYNYLRRRDCLPGKETVRLARALAAEAALTLMHAEVPYDTDFEPWVQVLVQDVVRRRLRWH